MSELKVESGKKLYKLPNIFETDEDGRQTTIDIDTMINKINIAIQDIERQGGDVISIGQLEGEKYIDDGFESGVVREHAIVALVLGS